MTRQLYCAAVAAVLALAVSCAGKSGTEAAPEAVAPGAVSMETLYAENGYPVGVRALRTEEFSVYLKYPAVLQAQSESTAYASLNDVVRKINAKVGDQVERDQVILSFSLDNKDYQRARLSYENARRTYERSSALFTAADISRQEFDTARTQYELAEAAFEAAADMINVKSPITGTITRLDVHVTENARPGTPLFTVAGTSGFEARFYAGAGEIDRIKTGARVYAGDPGQGIEGRISQVSLMMDSAKQAFPVTASFDSGLRNLASGMGVDVAVETYHNDRALVLSRAELVRTGAGNTVFIADNGVAKQVAVELGAASGLRYEVRSGLYEGNLLVYEGQQRLEGGTRLNTVTVLADGRQAD